MKKALITGITCQDGSYLAELLLDKGYELEVLKGAKETLNHIDYVHCEVNKSEIYEGNAFIEQIDDHLSLYNMKRVETSWWYGDGWGDALYIRGGIRSR